MPKPRKLKVLDGTDVPNPEDLAMLQALYSRSPQSVDEHLEKVRSAGSGKFMDQYYTGYGHKSIGDCGFIAMFIEQVSMLAAKAIQDTPLYCGQEASTRYLDMFTQGCLNPIGTPEGNEIQDAWMGLYSRSLDALVSALSQRYPIREGEKKGQWEKAIKARAFDIARSLLPAGATTLVAWSTNLRQTNDHLTELRHHPLIEIREIGEELHAVLLQRYPSSFGHDRRPDVESYVEQSMARFAFFEDPRVEDRFNFVNRLDVAAIRADSNWDLLVARPPRAELHQRLRRYGSIDFEFGIDFGSYRDIQRQRSAVQEMPLLTTSRGFHPWYLENLPEGTRAEIERIAERVNHLDASDAVKQYYTPMGYVVPVVMSCTLPSAVYIAELRSGETVHPTLRIRAQEMGEAIRQCLPGITVHCDMTPDKWSYKRGGQDIVAK